jgi:hypothetical protein
MGIRSCRGEPEPVAIEGEWIHPFALLRNLSDLHKHRNLVSIVMTPQGVSFLPGIKPGGITYVDFLLFTRTPLSDAFEVGTEVMRAFLPRHVEAHVEVAAYGTPAVTIEKNRPVLAALDRIAAQVVLLMSKFDPTP